MTRHFQRQIDKIKQRVIDLAQAVEESVENAIRAVIRKDTALASKVVEGDRRIDLMELEVEEECLHTLALHQPVAFDLRYVVAVLKINNDLERIGDLAGNIAEQAMFLANEDPIETIPYDLRSMAGTVRDMLKKALKALLDVDSVLADEVINADDQVDEIHAQMYESVEQHMRTNLDQLPQMIHLMNVSRHLERIGDLTVNIAEDIIYMDRGDILRHQNSRTQQLRSRLT